MINKTGCCDGTCDTCDCPPAKDMTTQPNTCTRCGKPLVGIHTCSPQVANTNDADRVINHDEALQLAQMKQHESNLARCYIELLARQAVPEEKKE